MITIITCLACDLPGPAGLGSSEPADSVIGAVTENRLVPSESYRSDRVALRISSLRKAKANVLCATRTRQGGEELPSLSLCPLSEAGPPRSTN
jgi:hypothetical protein